MRAILGITLLIASLSTAAAEMLVEEMFKRRGEEITRVYIAGLEAGMGYANANLANDGKRELFCLPKDITSTPEQMIDIIDAFVRAHDRSITQGEAVGLVLLAALKEKYPCKP